MRALRRAAATAAALSALVLAACGESWAEQAQSTASVVTQIGTSVTAQDAASSVSSALRQLASSYEQAFSRVDCS